MTAGSVQASVPARAVLLAGEEGPAVVDGGEGLGSGFIYTLRCLATDVKVTVNGVEQGLLDDPVVLASQDAVDIGGCELVYCVAGEAPQSLLIHAVTKLQASWRGYACRTSGELLLMHDSKSAHCMQRPRVGPGRPALKAWSRVP